MSTDPQELYIFTLFYVVLVFLLQVNLLSMSLACCMANVGRASIAVFLSPAYFRCFHAPTHLMQINVLLSGLCGAR